MYFALAPWQFCFLLLVYAATLVQKQTKTTKYENKKFTSRRSFGTYFLYFIRSWLLQGMGANHRCKRSSFCERGWAVGVEPQQLERSHPTTRNRGSACHRWGLLLSLPSKRQQRTTFRRSWVSAFSKVISVKHSQIRLLLGLFLSNKILR